MANQINQESIEQKLTMEKELDKCKKEQGELTRSKDMADLLQLSIE